MMTAVVSAQLNNFILTTTTDEFCIVGIFEDVPKFGDTKNTEFSHTKKPYNILCYVIATCDCRQFETCSA